VNKPLLIAGSVLVAVGIAAGIAAVATHDRWDDDRTIEYRVSDGDGNPANDRVIVLDEDGRRGPGFFPFFPLIVVGGILITVAAFSGRGRWHNGHRDFDSWHREAHWNWGSSGPRPDQPSAPSESEQPSA
jgi:hypothetical protein